MPITLITGPANAGKAHLVMDAVRGHLAHGQEPLLVVPTRADAEHYRRELAGGGAVLGVSVERFSGLIAEAVRRSGAGAPVLGGLARERLLAGIAARQAAPPTDRDAAHQATDRSDRARPGALATPGFVRALGTFVAELQVRRITPARLTEALARWASAEAPAADASVAELAPMFHSYERALTRMGLVDEEQRAVLALDALRRRPALWGQTPVLFYGFDDLTRLQLDAIETLGVVVGASVTVSLTYEPGRTAFAGRAGTFAALLPLAAEHRELRAREEYYAPNARAALSHLERSLFEPQARRLDPGGAVRLLEGGGERAELELVAREIGVLLEQGMGAGEIAVVLRAPGAAAELLREVFSAAKIPYALQRRRPFADTAIGAALIGLLRCAAAHGDGETADLLAWLRAPGLLERPELADRLEAQARRTGAVSAGQARALWEQTNWRLDTIDNLREAAERGPRALIARATHELEWLFAAPRRGQAMVLHQDELDEARALAAARRALAELAELALLDRELAPGDPGELAEVLQRVDFLSGPPPAQEAVAVLDPLALRARRVRALFVCRLQEGVFPAPARAQPFLTEDERRRLAEASGLRLGEHEDALVAERYLLYAAVSRPQELLVLSWHAAADDGTPQMRSLFVDDVCDLFEDSLASERVERLLGCVERPPGAVEVRLDGPRRGRPIEDRPGPLRDEQLLAELRAHTWSASSLEVWMSCPMRWLVERMLRARDLDPDPEPLARGGLAHAALKDTLTALRVRSGSARITPERLDLARELLGEALAENAPSFELSSAGERRPGLRRRLEADLDRYLQHAAATAGAEDDALEPTHVELGFGFADDDGRGQASGLPAFDIGGGVMLRGRIDRVDVGERGEAVVYDYKGRNAPPAAKWIAQGDLQVALYMRVIEGLLGLRAAGGFYQPLTGSDLRARGVLDGDSGVQIDAVSGDRRDGPDVRTLLAEAAETAREAAAQAGRGALEARPQTCSFKGGCAYPTICRCERS